jgi:hypothetical protein
MYHIAFYVPETHAELVKESMFKAGGGQIGNYDNCSFQYKGFGQFRPLQGSSPFLGSQGQVERLEEIKVEMICKKEVIHKVVAALKSAHPYETPAYYVIETVGF